MYGYGGFAPYVSVAEKKEKARRMLVKLKKKDPNLWPVAIEGTKIAKTWWGISWNKNLESYADYANRIGRGRSYARNGMILDLKILQGEVEALVHGSASKPYTIKIAVDLLPTAKQDAIITRCAQQIDSLVDLAAGKFPKELEAIFTEQDKGLFPNPKEINFDCSCLDWASMCKHVASVLYGIGARLDEDPLLFFKLRGVEVEALIKKSVEAKMNSMLENANQKTSRVLADDEIDDLFGL